MASAIAAAILLVAPLVALGRYYGAAYETGETNRRAYRFSELVAQHRWADETLVVDESFGSEGGGVGELRALRYLLAFDETPVRVVKITARRLEEELESAPSLLVILSGRQLRDVERLPLEPLTPRPDRGGELALFRLWRAP